MRIAILSSLVFLVCPPAHADSVSPGDECLVRMKAAPLKRGDQILGYLLRGTLVKVDKVTSGFARVTVDQGLLDRNRDAVLEAPQTGRTVSGYIDLDYLRVADQLPSSTGGTRGVPLSPPDVLRAVINSHNGARESKLPLTLTRQLRADCIAGTFNDAKNNQELRATLQVLCEKIQEELERKEGLDRVVRKGLTDMQGHLKRLDLGLAIDRRIADISDEEYKRAANTSAWVKTLSVGASIGLAYAGEYETALQVGAGVFKEDQAVTDAKKLLESKERARDATRKEYFHHIENINLVAELLWQKATGERPAAATTGLLVDCHDGAGWTGYEHDRVGLWHNFNATLTNCLLKVEVTGDRTVNAYQFVSSWSRGEPIFLRLFTGTQTKHEGQLGCNTCGAIRSIRARLCCDQFDAVLETTYDYGHEEKRFSAWQRLRDLELKVAAEKAFGLRGEAIRLRVWYSGASVLRDLTLDAYITKDAPGGGTYSAGGGLGDEVKVDSWASDEYKDYYVYFGGAKLWFPTEAVVTLYDRKYNVETKRKFAIKE